MFGLSGYAIGGLALLLVLMGGYAYIERQGRQLAEAQVAQEQEANKINQKTIALLRKSNELFEEIAGDLRKTISEIEAKEDADDTAITDLENSDEAVKKFLNTPTPPKLRCLWGEISECSDQHGSAGNP